MSTTEWFAALLYSPRSVIRGILIFRLTIAIDMYVVTGNRRPDEFPPVAPPLPSVFPCFLRDHRDAVAERIVRLEVHFTLVVDDHAIRLQLDIL